MASLLKHKQASVRQWVAVMAAITGSFYGLMESGITSVTIRDVQGALGTAVDEGSWISTAYLIGEIIAVPSAAYLCDIISPRKYLTGASVLFVIFSMYSASAQSLHTMLFARFLQGLAGGTFLPLASYMIVNQLPLISRNTALFLLGFSAAVAPSIGALYGGWLCVNFGWKACYFVLALLAVPLIFIFHFTVDARAIKKGVMKSIDVIAIIVLSIGLGGMTFVLQEGNRLGWTDDPNVWKMALAAVSTFAMGAYLTTLSKHPFIDFRVAWRRNFLACNFANLMIRVATYANLYLVSLYLTRIQSYDAFQVAHVVKWTGVAQIVTFPLVWLLVRWLDGRIVIIAGTLLFMSVGVMNSMMTHEWVGDDLVLSQVVRALAQTMVLAPMTGLAFFGIDSKSVGSAAALFSGLRQFGGPVGAAILGTFLSYRHTLHFARVSETVTAGSLVVQGHMDKIAETYAIRGSDGDREALIKLSKLIDRESYVMSYADAYILISVLLLLAIPAIALARRQSVASRQKTVASKSASALGSKSSAARATAAAASVPKAS
jgi:DHA2 family multidrug resistance protein